MPSDLIALDHHPTVPVTTPFRPGRIVTCPLCGLDLTPRTVHYRHGVAVCLDCLNHAYPIQLARYLRCFMRHARPSEVSTFKGLIFWTSEPAYSASDLPSWIQYAPKSVRTWLLSMPLINPGRVEFDQYCADVRQRNAIAAICRDQADKVGHAIGGYEPRFKANPILDQAADLRRQVQSLISFD